MPAILQGLRLERVNSTLATHLGCSARRSSPSPGWDKRKIARQKSRQPTGHSLKCSRQGAMWHRTASPGAASVLFQGSLRLAQPTELLVSCHSLLFIPLPTHLSHLLGSVPLAIADSPAGSCSCQQPLRLRTYPPSPACSAFPSTSPSLHISLQTPNP